MTTTLFKGGTVACHGSNWVPACRVDVLVVEGRIAEVGHVPEAPAAAEIVDASGWLLLPGFFNSHTHSPEVLARGRATGAMLDEWLAPAYRDLDAIGEERVAKAIAIGAREMIESGVVAVTDHFRQLPQSAATLVAAGRAWQRTGLKARLAVNLRDKAVAAGQRAQSVGELLQVVRAAQHELGADAIGPGPSAPQRCSDELLRATAALSRESGSFLHMHVCETAANALECATLYGESAVSHLARIGFLGPELELVHCVHLEDHDWALMAASGTAFVHCPLANMRLGSGIAPVMKAHRAGVEVRLATDGAASNDAQSMLEVVKTTVLLSRMRPEADAWVSPELALSMATRRGRIAVGEAAHLIAFDLAAPCFEESSDDELVPRAVLAARETAICMVMSQGRRLWTR